jgi:hypothetical protein
MEELEDECCGLGWRDGREDRVFDPLCFDVVKRFTGDGGGDCESEKKESTYAGKGF